MAASMRRRSSIGIGAVDSAIALFMTLRPSGAGSDNLTTFVGKTLRPFADLVLLRTRRGWRGPDFRHQALLCSALSFLPRRAICGTAAGAGSDRNLPADFDDLLARQSEIIGDVRSVALHSGEQHFLPMRQSRPALAVQHDLVADIIHDIVEPYVAALLMRLAQQTGNVRPLHEAEMGGEPPKILALLSHGHQLRPMHARPRLGQHAQHHDIFVQRPVLLEVPQHDRRNTARTAGEEY